MPYPHAWDFEIYLQGYLVSDEWGLRDLEQAREYVSGTLQPVLHSYLDGAVMRYSLHVAPKPPPPKPRKPRKRKG